MGKTMIRKSANFKRNGKDNDWRISKIQKEWERQGLENQQTSKGMGKTMIGE